MVAFYSTHRLSRFACLGLVLFLICSSLALRAAEVFDSGETAKKMDAFITEALKKYQVPGASIAIIQDGKPILIKGYGVRQMGKPEKVDAETLFQLASVSKTFTAAAISALVDQKKMKWEQPVAELLPGFQVYAAYPTKWMTAIDFCVHRAGFGANFGNEFDHLGFTREEILKRVRFIKPAYSFRDHPEYSNVGYFLAGETAAKVGGGTYEEVVEKTLLTPLGMKRTGNTRELMKTAKNVSGHHAMVDGKVQGIGYNDSGVFVAAGGWASTATDMAAYVDMLLDEGKSGGKQVLSAEALETLYRPVIVSPPTFAEVAPIGENTGFDYSAGWGVYYYQNERIIEKGGGLDGVRTLVTLVPDRKLGVVTLCNQNLTVFPEAVRAQLLEMILGGIPGRDLQKEVQAAQKKIDQMLGARPQPPEDAAKPSQPFANFAGTYQNDLFGTWVIRVNMGENAKQYPLILEAGPAKYTAKIEPWDGETLAMQWPVFISLPNELPFKFSGKSKAQSFEYEGYIFTRQK